MTTPQGLPGDFTRAISFSAVKSTTETSSEGPLAAKRRRPSGERAMPQGRVPTLMVLTTSAVAASRTQIAPARPPLTQTLRPSGATLTQELTAPRQRGVVLRARPRLAAQSGACRSDWCSYIPPVFSTTLALPPAGGQNKQGLFCLVLGTSGGGGDWTGSWPSVVYAAGTTLGKGGFPPA